MNIYNFFQKKLKFIEKYSDIKTELYFSYDIMRSKHRKRIRTKKNWYVPIATLIIIGVLGFQIISMYSKLSGYRDKKASLEKELSEALTTKQELIDYEIYTQSDEYIKNTARNKLGLVGENEIVFREK